MLCFISVTSVISVRDTIFMEHVGDVLAKTRFEDRGARIKDKGTRIKDKGTRIKDKGTRIKDKPESANLTLTHL